MKQQQNSHTYKHHTIEIEQESEGIWVAVVLAPDSNVEIDDAVGDTYAKALAKAKILVNAKRCNWCGKLTEEDDIIKARGVLFHSGCYEEFKMIG